MKKRIRKVSIWSQDVHLGCIWQPLGRHLGSSWRQVGHLCAFWGSSWRSWVPSWPQDALQVAPRASIGPPLGEFGRHLGPQGATWRRPDQPNLPFSSIFESRFKRILAKCSLVLYWIIAPQKLRCVVLSASHRFSSSLASAFKSVRAATATDESHKYGALELGFCSRM